MNYKRFGLIALLLVGIVLPAVALADHFEYRRFGLFGWRTAPVRVSSPANGGYGYYNPNAGFNAYSSGYGSHGGSTMYSNGYGSHGGSTAYSSGYGSQGGYNSYRPVRRAASAVVYGPRMRAYCPECR